VLQPDASGRPRTVRQARLPEAVRWQIFYYFVDSR
jgi:hypothetical protein